MRPQVDTRPTLMPQPLRLQWRCRHGVPSVNTPTKARGIGDGQASDQRWIQASARQVAACAQGHTIVVVKAPCSCAPPR
jgi:hypothetical protein